MIKRIAAAILWFYAGWYIGASIAIIAGLSTIVGPLVGLGAAVFFAGDPLGVIWTRRKSTKAQSQVGTELSEVA